MTCNLNVRHAMRLHHPTPFAFSRDPYGVFLGFWNRVAKTHSMPWNRVAKLRMDRPKQNSVWIAAEGERSKVVKTHSMPYV